MGWRPTGCTMCHSLRLLAWPKQASGNIFFLAITQNTWTTSTVVQVIGLQIFENVRRMDTFPEPLDVFQDSRVVYIREMIYKLFTLASSVYSRWEYIYILLSVISCPDGPTSFSVAVTIWGKNTIPDQIIALNLSDKRHFCSQWFIHRHNLSILVACTVCIINIVYFNLSAAGNFLLF